MKLPKCSGEKMWTDYGYEYDCYAVHEVGCENCLANWHNTGGLYHPETGHKWKRSTAIKRFGEP